MDQQAIETWLKATAVYGLAFVALSVFTGICLYGFWHFVRNVIDVVKVVSRFLPQWFDAQIESHKAVVASADSLTRSLGGVRIKADSLHDGLTHLTSAAESALRKHGEIDRDVVYHVENARKALEGGK